MEPETNFVLPQDGWYQIAATGEFKHKPTGLNQIIDAEACQGMADDFAQRAAEPNFGGILIDFDHFSLDPDKASEAAGWITAVEPRESGLWAQIRWSDAGKAAVTGGRYRFVSPVWMQGDCESCGNKKVRPMRLKNCALTNDPNIPGMVPLSNRATPDAIANATAKKKIDLAGLTVHIDRPIGFVQKGKDAQGAAWERTYKNDYGFLKKTNGGDDEELDVFVGPNPNAGKAFVIEQADADGAFDELKLMLGFDSKDEACACYDAHIPAQYRTRIHECPVSLVQSLCNCDTADIAGAVGALTNRKKCGMKNSCGHCGADCEEEEALCNACGKKHKAAVCNACRQKHVAMCNECRTKTGAMKNTEPEAGPCPDCKKGTLRYDDGSDAYVCDACGAKGQNGPAGITLSNRDAYHFARGLLNAEEDIYLIPGTSIAYIDNRRRCKTRKPMQNAGLMSDDQRKAMFARLRGGSGGSKRGGGSPSSETSPSTTSTTTTTEQPIPGLDSLAGTDYDVGAREDRAQQVDAIQPDAGGGPAAITPNSPTRDSIGRVQMYQNQIDALKALKSQPPETRDYSKIDVRQLEKDLYKQGKGTNEIMKELADAKAENERRRNAIHELKKKAKHKYPHDPDKQKAELDRQLQKIVDEDNRASKDWTKTDAILDKAIAKLEAAKSEETIRAQEELNKAAQRDMKDEAKTAADQEKSQKQAADKAAREQKAALKAAQDAQLKAQIAKDKAEAKRLAQQKTPVQEFRSKQATTRTYWDAIAMGDLNAADKILPGTDVKTARAQYESLAGSSTASMEERRASQKALAELKKMPPPAPIITEI